MLIKLAALGTLGYVGYRFLQSGARSPSNRNPLADLRIAGGPLSDAASVQHSPDEPPITPIAT